MKKVLTLILGALISVVVFGQTQIYFDDFESPPYTVPGKLSNQNTDWSTWNDLPGSDEDADIVNTYSHTGSQSVQINLDNGTNNDIVFLTKSKTSGFYKIGFYMNVVSGKKGYFNIQQLFDPPTSTYEWGMQVYFRNDGTTQVDAGGANVANPTYTQATWLYNEVFVDLDNDYAEYYLNNVFIVSWQFSSGWDGNGNTNQLMGIDLYAEDSNAEFYVDDFNFIQLNPPENLSYAVSGNDVVLSWDTPPTKALNGYNIYRDGIKINTTTVVGNTYTDAGMDAGTYSYYLTAVYDDGIENDDESAASNTVAASLDFYNFENGSAGVDQVACLYGLPWNTWDDNPCSATDGNIVSTQAQSGVNSAEVTGNTDLVYDAGNMTSGTYKLAFYMYNPFGSKGYFNVLQEFDPIGGNYSWGMQVTFENGMATVDADGSASATYSYTPDTWEYQEIFVNLDIDTAFYYFNSTLVKSWKWSKGTFGNNNLNQLGGVDFYALDGTTNGLYYFDDFDISEIVPPTNLNYSLVGNNVNLTWDSPTNSTLPLLGYNVYRDGTQINASSVTSEYFTDPGLAAGTYSYYVTAVYDDGSQADDESGPSNSISVALGYQNTLNFFGVDDYIDVGNTNDINTGGPFPNRTIEAWFRCADVNSTTKQVIFEEGGGSRGFNIYIESGTLYVGGWNVNETGWQGTWLTTSSISSYIWHHVTLRLENGNDNVEADKLKGYLDGIEFGSGDASQVYAHGGDIVIGRNGGTKFHDGNDNSDGEYFLGKIDEVRIWNEARTLQQIRDNMYRELIDPASEVNLAAYFQFNQSSGNNLPDNSANSNNGTLFNMDDTDWINSTAPIPYYTIADGLWTTYGTWAAGQLPPENDWSRVIIDHNVIQNQDMGLYDLVINGGSSLTVNPGFGLTMFGDIANYAGTNGLVMQADATGMGQLVHNTAGVEATVEEYLSSQQWHYVSSPISGATIESYLNIYLMSFNEPTGAWTYLTLPLSTPLNIGQGYAAWASNALTGSTTVSYDGMLNTGDISYSSLTYTPISANTGYNLVGNPYPSSIEWNNNWSTTNIDATVQFYTGSGYVTWNKAGYGTAASGVISPTQGFIAQVSTSAPANITFPQSERLVGNQAFYKGSSTINGSVTLEVEGNNYSDKIIVGFDSEATDSFDSDFDAYDLKGIEAAPQFYTMGDVEYTVNILNSESHKMIIPVGLDTGIPGIYSININNLEGLNGGSIILEDLKENTFTELGQNDSYSFSTETNDISHRFNIHFKSGAVGIGENSESNIFVYSVDNMVYIQKPADLEGNVFIYNMMGQEVYSQKAGNEELINIPVNNGTGYYVVKVQSDNLMETQKVFIK